MVSMTLDTEQGIVLPISVSKVIDLDYSFFTQNIMTYPKPQIFCIFMILLLNPLQFFPQHSHKT